MALDPRIEAVRKEYGLSETDFWQIPQNKQWVCKHAALEVVAVKAGIVWDMPVIIEADAKSLVTSMIVRGTFRDRAEWATGETNPTNYRVKEKQPGYPWAMTEKRAKDRVILKLLGIHGLVYSEDEMAPESKAETVHESNSDDQNKLYWDARFAIRDAATLDECMERFRLAWKAFTGSAHRDGLKEEYDGAKLALAKHVPRVPPNFDHLQPENAQ